MVKKSFLTALLMSLLLLGLFPMPVFATDPPDSYSIDYIHVNRHLIETNDMLVFAKYHIAYTVLPTDTIADTYFFRLMDVDGTTELASNTAYPYVTSGYGYGIVSFYFAAADAPAWAGNYFIQIAANPAKFASPFTQNFAINAANYTSLATMELNQDELKSLIVILAQELETAWSVDLLDQTDTGTVLALAGETYFRNAIPGIQSMTPTLFMTQIRDPDYTERTFPTTQADTYRDRFNGTWVKTGLDAVAGLFDTSFNMIGSIVIVLVCLAWLGLSVKYAKKPTPGFLCSAACLICGLILGWVPMALGGIIWLLCSLYSGIRVSEKLVG